MITLFATPKPFQGHIAVIQRNAMKSWTLLRPRPEIILFGEEEGTAETAKELGLRYFPQVERNSYGTPLISDIFSKAGQLSSQQYLCYVNSDIILMSDFMEVLQRVSSWRSRFLVVGRRWDFAQKELLSFEAGWEPKLRQAVQQHGKLHGIAGIDYFVFSKGLFGEIPPFAIGRTVWDNWLVYRSRAVKAPLIDATEGLTAVHQNHDYSHKALGYDDVWKGPEAQTNWELAGGTEHVFAISEATHKLTAKGLKRALPLNNYLLKRQLDTIPVLHPTARLPIRFLRMAIHLTYAIRKPLRLVVR